MLAVGVSAVSQYGQYRPSTQSSYDVSPEQWASLNPFGSDANSYPPADREQMEELQKQWAKFLEYLPWLKVWMKIYHENFALEDDVIRTEITTCFQHLLTMQLLAPRLVTFD